METEGQTPVEFGSNGGLGLVPTRAEVEALMKRCQVGVGGRYALENAHSIMADCYGTLGALRMEVERLGRWRSTHAPRIEALEGLLRTAQIEAHAGREAVASLASEREANAQLTEECEALRAEVENLRAGIRELVATSGAPVLGPNRCP